MAMKDSQPLPTMPSTLLWLHAIKARTGLSRSTLRLRMAESRFAGPVALGGRAIGWVEAEVAGWLTRQIESRRDAQPLQHKQRRRQS